MICGVLAVAVTSLGVYLPNPCDAHGWGLRVHNLSARGPYLVGETIFHIKFNVTLINFSKETRYHDPLPITRIDGDLLLPIMQPDGTPLPQLGRLRRRDPFTEPFRLRPGEFSSLDSRFVEFGYSKLRQLGRYHLEPTLKIDGKTIPAPPIKFEVIEPSANAILVSHIVPLEGSEAMKPALEQCKPLIQQVTVGKRTLLIYRRCYDPKAGGGIYLTARLAELPGKCEMTVEGGYGAWKPLTITYKDENSPSGTTKLVIHSVDGMPWTDGDEAALREREKKPTPPPAKP